METNIQETEFVNALDKLLVSLDYLDELNDIEEKKNRLVSIAYVYNAINNIGFVSKLLQ